MVNKKLNLGGRKVSNKDKELIVDDIIDAMNHSFRRRMFKSANIKFDFKVRGDIIKIVEHIIRSRMM